MRLEANSELEAMSNSHRERVFRASTFVCGLLTIFLTSFSASIADAQPAPKLAIPEPVFRFGSVREGTTVEALFELRNEGDAPLEIKRIQPACGCTGAFVDSSSIQPGQQSRLKVQFDTTGFIGPKVKTVRFFTNEVQTPSAVVTLSGTVQPEIEVDPMRVSFGTIHRGNIPTRIFRVFSDSSTGVQVKEISSRSEFLKLDTQDLNERGKFGMLVTVRLSENIPLGNFRGRILIRTTSKRLPIINVNVFANVSGDIDLMPDEVSFGLLDGPLAAPVTKKIEIRALPGKSVAVKGVQSDNRSVQATISTLRAGQLYELIVTLAEGTTGVLRSRLTLETESADPEQRRITVPVYAIISAKGN